MGLFFECFKKDLWSLIPTRKSLSYISIKLYSDVLIIRQSVFVLSLKVVPNLPSIYSSIYYWLIYSFISIPTYFAIYYQLICLFIYSFRYLFIHLSISLSILLFKYIFINLSISLSILLFKYIFINLSILA